MERVGSRTAFVQKSNPACDGIRRLIPCSLDLRPLSDRVVLGQALRRTGVTVHPAAELAAPYHAGARLLRLARHVNFYGPER